MNFTTPANNSSNLEVSVIKYQGTLANVTEDENAVIALAKSLLNDSNATVSVINATNTTVAGLSAYQMVYTAPLNGIQMKALETWIIKDGNLYQIVYEAPASNYDTYLSTAQQMIDSFQIK